MDEAKYTAKENRKFGISVGIAFMLLGGILLWRNRETGAIVTGVIGAALFLGGIGSWFGAWGMQVVLFQWLVVEVLGESAARVGTAQMTVLLPSLLFLLVGGAMADRVDRRRAVPPDLAGVGQDGRHLLVAEDVPQTRHLEVVRAAADLDRSPEAVESDPNESRLGTDDPRRPRERRPDALGAPAVGLVTGAAAHLVKPPPLLEYGGLLE